MKLRNMTISINLEVLIKFGTSDTVKIPVFPFTGLVADINIKFVVSFKCANVGNLELSCAIPATGWSSTGRNFLYHHT